MKNILQKILFLIKSFFLTIFLVSMVSSVFFLAYSFTIFCLKSDHFRLEEIIIENNHLLSDERIIEILNLDENQNLLFFNERNKLEKLLKSLYIEKAKIEIIFPRTIKIKIKEYQPIAYILNGDKLDYITQNGKVFRIINSKNYPDLPIIQKKKITEAMRKFITTCYQKSEFVYHKISEIYENEEGIYLSLVDSSVKILIGKDNFSQKIVILDNFLNSEGTVLDFADIEYLDLRFSGKVHLKEDLALQTLKREYEKLKREETELN